MPRKRALRSILTPMSLKALKFLRGLLLLSPAFLLTGCSKVSGLGFEEGLSSVNDQSLSLWQGAWIAAGVVGVFTLILILWPAFFHRLKKDSPEFPKQTQYNIPVEVLYTIIPFIIVAVLFYFTAQKQTVITAKTDTYKHEITVAGFQWSWQFGYPEAGQAVFNAIEKVLSAGPGHAPLTPDIGGKASTEDLGKAIAAAI